ncbi:hypothetical protein [Phenylobacterium sp.]|uniref:hypothetical protein n=1 Tax=Phenylobacterium sp. TaxID=1871053 RepID=UPI002ED8AEFC
MSDRWLALIVAALLAAPPAAAQRVRPDLDGIWSNRSLTTLERRPAFKTLTLSEAEARAAEKALDGRPAIPADEVGQVETEWWEPGLALARVDGQARTSWIVEPADGRLPYSEAGLKALTAAQAADRNAFDGPEVRPGPERCLMGGGGATGPPIQNPVYNGNYRIVQTPDHVVIVSEMIMNARIIPLRPMPPLPESMRPWTGDPSGRWEGDTLVVETRGLHPGAAWRMPSRLYLSKDARVVERFTRVSETELRYAFTVEDPTVFTRPWRAEMLLRPATAPMFEYACHEGNYSLFGALAGARRIERDAATPSP